MIQISPVLTYILYPVLVICCLYFLTKKSGTIIARHIGWQIFIAVSAMGTFVHDLSHALIAKLFGHNILEFRPFLFDLQNGELGYVQTQYASKNGWHMIGAFCMAVAPLFVGTALIHLLLVALVPNSATVLDQIDYISQQLGIFELSSVKRGIMAVGALAAALFDLGNFGSLMFWFFFPISFSIAIHLVPSSHDFRNMVPGSIGLGLVIYIAGSSDRFWMVSHFFYRVGDAFNGMLTLTLIFTVIYFVFTVVAAGLVTFIRNKTRGGCLAADRPQ